ncbi:MULTISPECIES: AI-2E family transporter [Alcaligenes]|jgi:predicted PurR-regulated permease PerM|uniref:AI-2E family transporter n=1 Tax=Alcaligenes aquatilis TaxID=323284 RepID=A0A3G2HT42_9BURK|nr:MULTISPECIES: AI-2E family transporter [Alcaligenes]AWG33899.1 AI-2E family transporter [Alcaligenes aquatilis]AYN20322.1 AI-2E family transporter [Alcaligenes aquatilis]MCC9163333.1 AI-2E family transporter [Alcaligenes sp. MMA]MCH4224626.1 AI-2E family transporter [Alcaligenes faecalis]QXR37071.1 AI-2E family transporter [Alcaligenes aquatilis]
MSTRPNLQFRTFLLLLAAVSAAFVWILLPFYGAIFWGAVLAILFIPLQRKLLAKTKGRRSLSALISLLVIVLIVIIPVILISMSLVQQIASLYELMNSGQLNPGAYLQKILNALPPSVHDFAARFGLHDTASLQEKFSQFAVQGGQFLTKQALNVGQNTFQFLVSLGIMLYMLFFLLRDGVELGRHYRQLIPLSENQKTHLFRKFTTVVRATVKGNIAVAATQGALGGIMFWFLDIQGALFWGVLMAVLSLLPAVGASLIWAPVAIYFFVAGHYVPGIILTAFGILVIGLVDNLLRPLLVGKDTKIPDYVILISTLGGLSIFGLNGFVIGPLIAAMFIACWDLFPSAVSARVEAEEQENHSN